MLEHPTLYAYKRQYQDQEIIVYNHFYGDETTTIEVEASQYDLSLIHIFIFITDLYYKDELWMKYDFLNSLSFKFILFEEIIGIPPIDNEIFVDER